MGGEQCTSYILELNKRKEKTKTKQVPQAPKRVEIAIQNLHQLWEMCNFILEDFTIFEDVD